MSADNRDFRHISIAALLMVAFAVLAIVMRDAGYRTIGQLLMAACIVSFGFTVTTFTRFLRRHASKDNDQ